MREVKDLGLEQEAYPPICGPGPSCEIVGSFLDREEIEQFKVDKQEKLFEKYKDNLVKIDKLKNYLSAIREEEDRTIIEIYRLTTSLDG